ncbi:MAG: WD40/YVTN/BNR-like repeat-containing protein [Planctomycetota bacterium]
MSDRILLGTRKGLFAVERRGERRWEIGDARFLGSPVNLTLTDLRDGAVYAALDHGHFGAKLQRSRDGGQSFEEIAMPCFAEAEEASVKAIWSLSAGSGAQPGRLYAGTIPGALFISDDHGDSWSLVRSLWDHPTREKWFGGGTDLPALHSILVDPRDDRHLWIALSCAGVWETRDGGESWENIGEGLRAEYMPPEMTESPLVQDPHMLVSCRAAPDSLWMQHHNGVFRSSDGGRRWQECTRVDPSAFGFAIAVDPDDPRVAWTVPGVKDECRVAVDAALCVSRTLDGGEGWQALREGLPQRHAYDIVFRHALDVSADGRRLAFGTSTGSVYVSEDRGESWMAVGEHLPQVYSVAFG